MQRCTTCTERCDIYGTKIHCRLDKIIGHGSTGVVYKGFYESPNVPVAVKTMRKTNVTCFRTELKTLQEFTANRNNDGAVNLVRYYGMEEAVDQFVLATELCDMDLEQFLNKPRKSETKYLGIKFIKDICRGLLNMHSMPNLKPIVHRDIKPSNILIKINPDGSYTAKLADFGISKQLPNFCSATTTAAGTYDWMSPACLLAIDRGNKTYRASTKDDIFSLGMLIYYIWSSGCHPFGNPSFRASNIRQNKPTIDNAIEENFDFQNLVRAMIHNDPEQRPNINQVIEHPFFWTDKHCLDFVIELCTVLRKNHDNFRACLESRFVIMNDSSEWYEVLDTQWRNYIVEHTNKKKNAKRYSYNSYVSLLEFIRDKFAHCDELSLDRNLIALLRNHTNFDGLVDATSYMRYFRKKFPKLILVACTTTGIECLQLNAQFQLPSRHIFQLGPTNEEIREIRRLLGES